MKAKALEIRDHGTFIPALAVDMNPADDAQRATDRPMSSSHGWTEAAKQRTIRMRGAGERGRTHTTGSSGIGMNSRTAMSSTCASSSAKRKNRRLANATKHDGVA